MLRRVQDDRKRNVSAAPQVNVVGIRDVVDDEVAGIERLSSLVVVVVPMRLLSQRWAPKRHNGHQKE